MQSDSSNRVRTLKAITFDALQLDLLGHGIFACIKGQRISMGHSACKYKVVITVRQLAGGLGST